MKADFIELRLLRLPLVHFFETSFGRLHEREFIVVTVSDGSERGYGECVAERDPFYSPETTATAWTILSDYLVPRVLGQEFADPRDVFAALGHVRGHNMAKAALEMALWDLDAKRRGLPLWRVLGGTRSTIESGVSVGIQDSLSQLVEKVEMELAAGYRRVKIKVKPGWDVDAVSTIRAACGRIPLMVDANAAYRFEDADRLAPLDEFDLMMIEQPLAHDDLHEHARLQARLRTPICLDESIHSPAAAAHAIELGSCRIINIKPGRVGGLGESIRLHDLCAARGIPVWHGGMLESGIGRAHNIHLASLANFSLPGDIAASQRYFAPDLIDPPITVSPEGTIPVPTDPGIGVRLDLDRIERATERLQSFSS